MIHPLFLDSVSGNVSSRETWQPSDHILGSACGVMLSPPLAVRWGRSGYLDGCLWRGGLLPEQQSSTRGWKQYWNIKATQLCLGSQQTGRPDGNHNV